MSQLSVLELAKQGDANAIAILINRSLQPKGIKAEARRLRDRLDIILHSTQTPNQKALESLLQRGMVTLQIGVIRLVHIYARRTGSDILAWESEFELDALPDYPPEPQIEPEIEPEIKTTQPSIDRVEASPASLALSQRSNVYSAPESGLNSGIIAVPKLNQIEHNPQEYQDVIVRFSDRYGTIRCLSTLTEVVQAISKSSFSFSSVATNPTLRNLLDTMAEMSTTDDNGDQVVSYVSVLQPGQQWQKAKIRVVTKIIFEPDSLTDSVPSSPSRQNVITLDAIEMPSESQDLAKKDRVESNTLEDFDIGDTLIEEIKIVSIKESAELPESAIAQPLGSTISTKPRQTLLEDLANALVDRSDSPILDSLDDFGNDFGSEIASEITNEIESEIEPSIDSDRISDRNRKDSPTLDDFSQDLWDLVL